MAASEASKQSTATAAVIAPAVIWALPFTGISAPRARQSVIFPAAAPCEYL